jgi:hypothetical protein
MGGKIAVRGYWPLPVSPRQTGLRPPHPPPHVVTKPGEALGVLPALLIKPATTCDEMLEGVGGNRQSCWAEMRAQPGKSLRNASYKHVLSGCFATAREAKAWLTTLTAWRSFHRVGASTKISSINHTKKSPRLSSAPSTSVRKNVPRMGLSGLPTAMPQRCSQNNPPPSAQQCKYWPMRLSTCRSAMERASRSSRR